MIFSKGCPVRMWIENAQSTIRNDVAMSDDSVFIHSKTEMSADFALQPKKDLRKKRVNLDAEILRQKCVNYQNPENFNYLPCFYSKCKNLGGCIIRN